MFGCVKRICTQFKLVARCTNQIIMLCDCDFVQFMLEYGSVLWNPHAINHSCLGERALRIFLYVAGYVLKINH